MHNKVSMRTTLSAASLAESMPCVDHRPFSLDMCEKDSSVNRSACLLKRSIPCQPHICLSFARLASQIDHKCWELRSMLSTSFSFCKTLWMVILTAITMKNCCHWRYTVNKKRLIWAQDEHRKTSVNRPRGMSYTNPLETAPIYCCTFQYYPPIKQEINPALRYIGTCASFRIAM